MVDEFELGTHIGIEIAFQQSLQWGNDERQWSAHVVADVSEEAHLCLIHLSLLLDFHVALLPFHTLSVTHT